MESNVSSKVRFFIMLDDVFFKTTFFSSVVSTSDMSSIYLFFLYIEEDEVMPECLFCSFKGLDLTFLPFIFLIKGILSASSSVILTLKLLFGVVDLVRGKVCS